MREMISTQPRQALLREYTDGPLAPGQVRVRTQFASAKHGTEFTLFRGLDPHLGNRFDEGLQLFLPDPQAQAAPFFFRPGNMFVGTVCEVGSGAGRLNLGDVVAGYGPFRETHRLQAEHALPLPQNMSWREATCYDPAQFALGGIRDGQVKLGDQVAVFGLGAIGLLAAQMAKLAGASQVIVCDPIRKRRDAALANGADVALDPSAEDAGLRVKELTGRRGADVILETSGSYAALQAALRGIAYGCNIAVVGWYHQCQGGLDFGREAHFNRPNLIFSRAFSQPDLKAPNWDFDRLCATCWDLLAQGKLRCENILDPVVPFAESAQAYMDIEQDPGGSIKLGVVFENQ
jgi:threonine dehydrogenase-like Zn-dependent dehydrogenase